ncbi:MAG TPA: CoA transferase [Rubrivivax sp.]|nr:CoA transferase [Rubrivivax sp.]
MGAEQLQPLSGYRVLDLTLMTAGPVGTMMLGDLGADVVKIEEIGAGDFSRAMGTLYVEGESANFLSQNRNKRSLRMAREADVVTENFRPGALDRLGVGYEAVRAVNPEIVFASISAFGQSGPYPHLPANDPIVQALSGLMHMTGDAGGDPVRIGHPYPDFGAAALLAYGVCAALLHRERTGQGQWLDLNLLHGTVFSAIPRDGEALRTGKAPPRMGSGHPAFVPYRNYAGGDGRLFFLSCFTEKFWASVCDAIGRPELKSDERTRSNVACYAHRDFVDGTLEQAFAGQTSAFWLQRLAEFNVPSAPVQDIHQALREDPQMRHNGAVVALEHPTAGAVETLAHPVNFRGTPARYQRPPPRFGEHTAQVLQQWGFDAAEVDALFASGAVAGLESA